MSAAAHTVACPECRKSVKAAGLRDHMRVKHDMVAPPVPPAPPPVDPLAHLSALERELLEALANLASYDQVNTEYDGRCYDYCPSCSAENGKHEAGCEYVSAKQLIARASMPPAPPAEAARVAQEDPLHAADKYLDSFCYEIDGMSS